MRLRTLATAVLGVIACIMLVPASAHAAQTGTFTLRCFNPTNTPVGELILTYQYPRSVKGNVVQTYDTIRFTPASSDVAKVRGTIVAKNTTVSPSKTFSIPANRTSRLNWKLSIPGNEVLGIGFVASIATTYKGKTASYYATCVQ